MMIVFDNNLPACLAHGVRELSKGLDVASEICHITDKLLANTPDSEWIQSLAKEKQQVIVITQDKLNKANEAIILRESGLTIFHLDKGWASQPYWDKAHNLVRWWPLIVEQAQRINGPATFRVQWKFTKKFVQVSLR